MASQNSSPMFIDDEEDGGLMRSPADSQVPDSWTHGEDIDLFDMEQDRPTGSRLDHGCKMHAEPRD
jgi:hypothetical protein